MVDNKFMLVSLSDPKMKGLAEVLGNKTCKKIIDYLAENEEASQKDLADSLNLGMSKVDYNIKKLVDSGLIQKRKNFFWSKKGKKIVMYELSNKSIIISPRKSVGEKLKSLIPAFLITFVGTFVFWVYEKLMLAKMKLQGGPDSVYDLATQKGEGFVEESIPELYAITSEITKTTGVNDVFNVSSGPLWLAFLGGALIILFVISIVNWRKL